MLRAGDPLYPANYPTSIAQSKGLTGTLFDTNGPAPPVFDIFGRQLEFIQHPAAPSANQTERTRTLAAVAASLTPVPGPALGTQPLPVDGARPGGPVEAVAGTGLKRKRELETESALA